MPSGLCAASMAIRGHCLVSIKDAITSNACPASLFFKYFKRFFPICDSLLLSSIITYHYDLLPTMANTAITNAHVFDGHSLHENITVVIENGLIASVGPTVDTSNADAIDGTGLTLLPGFIDAHVHLDNTPEGSLRLLLQLAKAGVTTALDMGVLDRQVRESFRAHSGIADVRSAGNFATSTGSIHSRFKLATGSKYGRQS